MCKALRGCAGRTQESLTAAPCRCCPARQLPPPSLLPPPLFPPPAGGGRVDYVEVVSASTLRPLRDGRVFGQTVLIAVAAHFGRVRLIDNVDFEVSAERTLSGLPV